MNAPQHVTCPQCRTQLDLSALPEIPPSVRCGQCANVFTTWESGDSPRWKGTAESPADPLLPPEATTAQEELPAGASAVSVIPPHLRQADEGSDESPSAGGDLLPPEVDGNRVLPTGAAPVPVPQVPTPAKPSTPTTAAAKSAPGSLNIQVDGHDKVTVRNRGGINAVWVILGASLALVAIITILVVVSFTRGPFVANMGTDSDDSPGISTDTNREISRDIKWTNAERFSAKFAGVKVRVNQFELGDIRARNEQNQVQTSDGNVFLQVFLSIENEGAESINYTSWYGNIFTVGDEEQVATLSDSAGNEYPMLTFRDAFAIHGHTPESRLRPNDRVRDTIVFEVPPGIDVNRAEYFRLLLPTASYGEVGAIGFEMPASMLESVGDNSGLMDGLNSGDPIDIGPDGDMDDMENRR